MRILQPASTGEYAQAHERGPYPRRMAERAARDLTPEQNEKVREVLRTLVRTRWDSNVSAAARDLGVDQSTLSKFESGAQGASVRLGVKIYMIAGKDPGPLVDLPERVVDLEGDSPELAAVLASPEGARWSKETVSRLRGLATAAREPVTERDLLMFGEMLEGRRRLNLEPVDDDPVERAKAARRKKKP